MRILLYTDPHYLHSNLVDYCGRPNNFSELIDSNLRKELRPTDTLICLGDVCMKSNPTEIHQRFIQTLDCKYSILIRGNHDAKTTQWYQENGWDLCFDSITIEKHGRKIVLSHKPIPIPDVVDKAKYLNIHGHLHNTDHRNLPPHLRTEQHRLFAMEYTDYRPVDLEHAVLRGIPVGEPYIPLIPRKVA